MANPNTKGTDTSEYSTTKKVVFYTTAIAGIISSALTGLLYSGLLAEGGQVAAVIAVCVTVLSAIAGNTIKNNKYVGGRRG